MATLEHYNPLPTPQVQASMALTLANAGQEPNKKFKPSSHTVSSTEIDDTSSTQPLIRRDVETTEELTQRDAKTTKELTQRDAETPVELTQGSNSNITDPTLLFIHREQQLCHDRMKLYYESLKMKK